MATDEKCQGQFPSMSFLCAPPCLPAFSDILRPSAFPDTSSHKYLSRLPKKNIPQQVKHSYQARICTSFTCTSSHTLNQHLVTGDDGGTLTRSLAQYTSGSHHQPVKFRYQLSFSARARLTVKTIVITQVRKVQHAMSQQLTQRELLRRHRKPTDPEKLMVFFLPQ